MRSEQMERIRRRVELEKQIAVSGGAVHSLDTSMPCDLCFKEAASDTKFWDEELHAKAVLYITHVRSKHQLSSSGHGLEVDGNARAVSSGGSQG